MSDGNAGDNGNRGGEGDEAERVFAEDDFDFLHDLHDGNSWEDGRPDGSADAGPGLTAPERELADELERQRSLERTRDRYEGFARERGMGVGGGTGTDADALAVIDAAARFGDSALEDDSSEAVEERLRISQALVEHARKPPSDPDEYTFYAIVSKQSTNQSGNLLLSLEVPWEHRHQVWKALEDMPFSCMVRMRGVED